MKSNHRLVYSTDAGRIKQEPSKKAAPKGDGIARLRRETKGRKGKGVTIIDGLTMQDDELKTLCKKLKQLCGTGGTVKDFTIEIQGDQRDKIIEHLAKLNITAKKSGG